MIAALFRFIDSLKAFPLIFVMTSGGPGTTTEPTNYYAYNEAFSFSNIGYGSAIALSVFGTTLLLSALLLKVVRSERADA